MPLLGQHSASGSKEPVGGIQAFHVMRFFRHLIRCVDRGPMIVVDASCAVDILIGSERGHAARSLIERDGDPVAPHLLDAEVAGVIRQQRLLGSIDATTASQAIDDLSSWPIERFGHSGLLARAWELRDNVRTWDAFYVALAEVLDAPLLTADIRLTRANGVRCDFELIA